MELLFEKSTPGHGCDIFPACDVPVTSLPEALARKSALPLPELSCRNFPKRKSAAIILRLQTARTA